MKEGRYFIHGCRTLKWKYCAQAIRNAIMNAGSTTSGWYQIPTTRRVLSAILIAPMELLTQSGKPYSWNSATTTLKWYIQTKTKETAIKTCIAIAIYNMYFVLVP